AVPAPRPAGPVRRRHWRRNTPAPARPARTSTRADRGSRCTGPSASRGGSGWGSARGGGPASSWPDATRRLPCPAALTGRVAGRRFRVCPDAFPGAVSEHLPPDAEGRQHLAGNLLDRRVGGAEGRNAFGAEQRLGLRNLPPACLELCVARVGPALLADLLQPDRVDRQAEQLLPVRPQ